MAQIRLNITRVGSVRELSGRSLEIDVEDSVRGPVVLALSEDESRWLYASLGDKVGPWRAADGDDV